MPRTEDQGGYQRREPQGVQPQVGRRPTDRDEVVVHELDQDPAEPEDRERGDRDRRTGPRPAVQEPDQLGRVAREQDDQGDGQHRHEEDRATEPQLALAVLGVAGERRCRHTSDRGRDQGRRPGAQVERHAVEAERRRAEEVTDRDVVDVEHQEQQHARPGERQPEPEELADHRPVESRSVALRSSRDGEHPTDEARDDRAAGQPPRAVPTHRQHDRHRCAHDERGEIDLQPSALHEGPRHQCDRDGRHAVDQDPHGEQPHHAGRGR